MFGQKTSKRSYRQSLLIISGIYPPDIGGPAVFASNFRDWEISKSKLVNVVTLTNGPSSKDLSQTGEIRRVSRYIPLFSRLVTTVWSIVVLARKSSNILVVGSFLESFVASLFSKKKRIVKVPGDIVWERARNSGLTTLDILDFQNEVLSLKYRCFRWLFSASLKSAEIVIAPSEFIQQLCLSWGVDVKKIILIHNGISVEDFSPKTEVKRDIQVLTVCRLTGWKGLEGLILACKQLDLVLNIVGSGPLRVELEDFARSQLANVVFMEDRTNRELQDIYRRSSVFVLNSSYEGLPHSLLEAMGSGCIVIANAGTGSAEVISHGVNGYLSDFSDELKLQEIIAKALNNPEFHRSMRIAARETVTNRFNRNVTFQEIHEVLEQL